MAPGTNKRYGARRVRVRRPLPVVVIVCDDSKTAVSYFTSLKREVRESVTLQIEPTGAEPIAVVDAAIEQRASLRDDESRDEQDRDAAWALIDLERETRRREEADKAKKAGAAAGINVALSEPCYEVWTLLHLVDTGQMFSDCSAVLDLLKKAWRAEFHEDLGKKAQADYRKILGNRKEAAARARRHCNDPSCTEIYLLSEEIDRLCAAGER